MPWRFEKHFLSATFRTFLVDSAFLSAIQGHLMPDRASQERLPLILKRFGEIAEMGNNP
jgi:hypothetical protein